MKKLLLLLVCLCMLLAACDRSDSADQSKPNESESGIPVTQMALSSGATVMDLKKKYGGQQNEQIMPFYNVGQDQQFMFDFPFDLRGTGLLPSDIISVHTHITAQQESRLLASVWDEWANNQTTITVKPLGPGVLGTEAMKRSPDGYWGGAPYYYIRINYSMEASEPVKLDQPIIVPFTVKSELPVPNLAYDIDSEGRLALKWGEVEGAERYHVYQRDTIVLREQVNLPVSGPEEGYVGPPPRLLAETTDTVFHDFMKDGSGAVTSLPDGAGGVIVSGQNLLVQGEFYVTAVVGQQESGFSVPVNTLLLSKRLPTAMKENLLFSEYATVQDIPKTVPVIFIDGSEGSRTLTIETEGVTIKEFGPTPLKYKVEGTAFTGYLYVTNITQQELGALAIPDAQEVGGYVQPENTTDSVPAPDVPTIISDSSGTDGSPKQPEALVQEQQENTRSTVEQGDAEPVPSPESVADVPVNADSALEEYLALHLIEGNSVISLKAFPEAQNFDTLTDVFGKVMYQNPLILGVSQYGYDYSTLTLYVEYDYTQDEIASMQEEIVKEAGRLVAELFVGATSEADKHLAIYQYLNDNTRYDDAALESAEQNNFAFVDPKYNNAFNAYGIMVEKAGVCASYAAVYKLLSDLAGLESIVVTGVMSGVPHAWNKVKIGQTWVHVDATNNETNSGIPYLLYKSSDGIAEEMDFFTDNEYWLDTELSAFAAVDDSLDYYVQHDKVVTSADLLTAKVAELLKEGREQTIVLRVASRLGDNELNRSLVLAFDQAEVTDIDNVRIGALGSYLIILR